MGPVSDDNRTQALAAAVTELERHAASGGWDAPVGVYALVRTRSALDRTWWGRPRRTPIT